MKAIIGAIFWLALGVAAAFAVFDDPDKGLDELAQKALCWPSPAVIEKVRLQNFCNRMTPYRLDQRGLRVTFHPTEKSEGLRVARVDRDYYYCHNPSGAVFKTPKDFFTNFASVPKWARFYINPMGDHLEAAVVHDWLYSVAENTAAHNRETADEVFKFVLEEAGVNRVKRNLMYWAVRVGAATAYNATPKIEMRREDWSTYEIDRPETAVIGNMPDCVGFDEKYGPLQIGEIKLGFDVREAAAR